MKGFPITIKAKVRWGEMDALDKVNNVVYFKYFEDARLRYLDQIGFSALRKNAEIQAVLASISVSYSKPMKFPDKFTVGVRVKSIARSGFVMEFRMDSEEQGKVATGEGVVSINNIETRKKVPVPKEVKAAIKEIEGKDI